MAIDVETLEESFDLVAPQGDELMRTFYDNLSRPRRPCGRCSRTSTWSGSGRRC